MTCCMVVCSLMATFDALQVILFNFDELILHRLRMSFDDKWWQTLHNTVSNGPVWPHFVNGDHVWSSMLSMNDLVLIEAEVRNLGLIYQIMADMARWGKIKQIWPKVAYNGAIFIIVFRYDRLGPYLSLYYLFCAILALSFRFDPIAFKVPDNRECGQRWSIMIQYVLL